MYVTSREDCGGGRCARSSESLVRGDVVARDSFIDFERVRTGVESWSCVSCGRFLGRIDDALGASARAIASELVETNEQTRDLPTLARVRGRDGDALALCEDSKRCAWRGRGDGGVGATFEGGREVDFWAFERDAKRRERDEDEDEDEEYYERVEALAARMYACELLDPEGTRAEAIGEKHCDPEGLEAAFARRANAKTEALRDALAGMNGERRECKEPTVEGWLRVVSIVVMNSAAVKIPNPMLRYVACLDGESEDARARATRALRPALEQMVREARELEDDESSDDDESSEDDEDAAYRDEVMEFDWGDGLRFRSDLFPSSEGIVLLGACSAINHSCEPNCEFAFIDSADVIVVATRDIEEDEEITVAYVPEELPLERRREELSTRYGFECRCARCARESGKRARVEETNARDS